MSLDRRALLSVFLVALCLRLAFWARLESSPGSSLRPDSVSYLAPADSLLKEGRFLGVDGAADSRLAVPGRPPPGAGRPDVRDPFAR